jgi:hypothetical protein
MCLSILIKATGSSKGSFMRCSSFFPDVAFLATIRRSNVSQSVTHDLMLQYEEEQFPSRGKKQRERRESVLVWGRRDLLLGMYSMYCIYSSSPLQCHSAVIQSPRLPRSNGQTANIKGAIFQIWTISSSESHFNHCMHCFGASFPEKRVSTIANGSHWRALGHGKLNPTGNEGSRHFQDTHLRPLFG